VRRDPFPPGCTLTFLIPLLALGSACGSATRPPEVRQIASAPSPTIESDASSLMTSLYGDVERVRFEGPAKQVLVREGRRPFITGGQYNAWLGTYPVNITRKDPVEGRREVLEQMVIFKMLARKARESGYEGRLGVGGGGVDEKSLVLTFIKDHVSNVGAVTEQEVHAYEARHPEFIANLDASGVPGDFRGMAIRGSVRGEQLDKQVHTWIKEAGIHYEDER
jgi:hypothetical protein